MGELYKALYFCILKRKVGGNRKITVFFNFDENAGVGELGYKDESA